MKPHRDWTVHLGVHKTGSTYIQDVLEAERTNLLAHNVDYIPRNLMRQSGLLNLLRKRGSYQYAPASLRRRYLTGKLNELSLQSDKLLISDENICGTVGDIFGERPYPLLERSLKALRSLFPGKLTIAVCIRNPATLLPSAYAQMIRFHPNSRSFSSLLDEWSTHPPRWSAFFSKLKGALPESEIRAWTFEDYTSDPRGLIREVFHLNLGSVRSVEAPSSTRRPTKSAVEAIEGLGPGLKGKAYQFEVAGLLSLHATGLPFDPLTAEQAKEVGRYYLDDLAAIERMGVRLIKM